MSFISTQYSSDHSHLCSFTPSTLWTTATSVSVFFDFPASHLVLFGLLSPLHSLTIEESGTQTPRLLLFASIVNCAIIAASRFLVQLPKDLLEVWHSARHIIHSKTSLYLLLLLPSGISKRPSFCLDNVSFLVRTSQFLTFKRHGFSSQYPKSSFSAK